jgi:hypothetical protein
MRLLRILPVLSLTSCLQVGTSADSDAGAGAAGSPGVTSGDAAASVPSGGSGCATDSVSGAMLCTGFDQCPGLTVDHDVFPDCGFRVPSTSIDLECVCGDFLCPVGAVLSCAQAKTLLGEQSEMSTCVQQNDGRCAPRSAPKPETTGCDKNCADACAGDINCRKLCGC